MIKNYFSLDALYFIILFSISLYILPKIKFIHQSGLSSKEIYLLFSLKVIAGIALGFIFHTYYPNNDYWGYNAEGIKEFELLKQDPLEFVKNITQSNYGDSYGRFLSTTHSYWNDLRGNILIKILAILNIISHGNYYINSLLLNFFSFMGFTALYRVFISVFPKDKNKIIISCFLLPSTLFFTSGIHKDLLVSLFLSFYVYALYFILEEHWTYKRISMLLLAAIGILLIRNFVCIALIPASIAYTIAVKTNLRTWIAFIVVYFTGILLIVAIEKTNPNKQPLSFISERQEAFLHLPKANSDIKMKIVEPNMISFIRNIPQAIVNITSPIISKQNINLFIQTAIIENHLYLLILIIAICSMLWTRRKAGFTFTVEPNNQIQLFLNSPNIIVFGIAFGLSMLIIIGSIIPNVGAITRYKSIFLPFIITPLICSINFKNFARLLN